MILKIFSKDGFRVIHPHSSFTDVGEGRNKISIEEKAEQFGRDLYQRAYLGHILEEDGKIISNTLENRERNGGFEKSRLKKEKQGPPGSGFKFNRIGELKTT